jgi:hypothetical protein
MMRRDTNMVLPTDDRTREKKDQKPSLLSDFYIEFLGSLVPGLFVVVLGTMVLAWSGSVLCHSICGYVGAGVVAANTQSSAVPSPFSTQLAQWKDLGLGPYGNIGLLLVVAYILGSIFYRRDPKIPDYRSAQWIWDNTEEEADRRVLAAQPRKAGANTLTPGDVQFPYHFLREYLIGRGLTRLAAWVPWSGDRSDSWNRRTKMFMNVLKVRLQFLVPERCKDIVRNEAHVRMATSVWYGTRWLTAIAVIALAMTLIAIALVFARGGLADDNVWGIIGFDVFALIVALLVKVNVEKFIHYMRVREIVYVLETADFASRNGHQLHPEDFSIKSANERPQAAGNSSADPS